MNELIARADGGDSIGLGHLVRCFSLATEWRRLGGSVAIVSADRSGWIRDCFGSLAATVIQVQQPHPAALDLATTRAAVLRSSSHAWVVLDGYHFDPAYQRAICATGRPVLVIDDMAHHSEYHCSILLNQNLHGATLEYTVPSYTSRLLGPRYALLRPEFRALSPRGCEPALVGNVLVALGGGDVTRTTEVVLRALAGIRYSGSVTVVLGPSSANPVVKPESPYTLAVLRTPPALASVMAASDLAICGAGTTCWELARVGVPMITLVMAPNQADVAASLEREGGGTNAGDAEGLNEVRLGALIQQHLDDRNLRSGLSRRAQALVDGAGATRVVEAMLHRRRELLTTRSGCE